MSALGPPGAQINPEEAENFEEIEKQFAVKAVQHLTTYWSLLQGIRGSRLKLTRIDDEILETFQKDFPEMDVSATINEDDMKSKEGKERWRNFVNLFDKRIEDFNVGAIVRTSHRTEYTEEGSIFVVRMQFYAIEIARNRAGLNDWVYEREHPDEAST